MEPSLARIINALSTNYIKNVVVLIGAGISTASGIPDFRSPGGLYQTLDPSKLTATPQEKRAMQSDPTMVVNTELFQRNQFPYLEVRRPFILGTAEKLWLPTLSHYFIRVLHDRGILKRLYTQNIDGLDTHIGLPEDKVVHVHGSLASVSCEFCGSSYPIDAFISNVKSMIKNIYNASDTEAPSESTHIHCLSCRKPGVKPSTVLFGRNLHPRVFECIKSDFYGTDKESQPDLVIVIGTSLIVHPAAGIVQKVNPGVPRLVVNIDRVGEELGLDFSANDVHLPSHSDAALLGIIKELGWIDDLRMYEPYMCENSKLLFK